MGLRVMWLYLILALLARRAVSWNDRRSAEDYKNDEDSYKGRLIYLQILTSNGFHAPLELYPGYKNTENAWPEGLGQLTKLGKLQHYQLGKMLRKRYQNIITSDPREVDVFSSFEDRTISSTLCLLASLYAPSDEWRFMPNYNWQPIPVSCVEGESDKYLGYDAFCPKRKEELKKIIKSGPGQEFLKKHEFLYSYLTNHTGLPMDDWNDVVRLFDTLSREHQVGLKVPYWARNFWKDMKQITDASYRWNFKSKLSLKTKTGSLINLMLDRMKVKTQQDDPDPSIKVDVYVTHDWNIASFLASMLRFNGLRPPPCGTALHYFGFQSKCFHSNSRFKWPVKMASVQRDHWCYVILQCLLLNLLLCRNGAFADKNKYYHISTLCTKERNLQMYKKIDGTVLTSEGEDNLECVLTFQTDTILQRFMLRFERLALDCNDHLYIFDGAHAFGNYKADLSCRSTRADVGTIFTQSNFVTLKYVTDKWTQAGNGFKLVITTFKDSPVGCRDFLCMNTFCITKDLTCDGVNHCGDNSDETSHAYCIDDTSGTEILGMAVGAFAVFVTLLVACGIFIAGVGVCLCRRARLQRQDVELESQNTSTHPLVAGHQPYPTAPRYTNSPDRHEEKPPPYPGGGYSPGTGITYNVHDESLYYPTK